MSGTSSPSSRVEWYEAEYTELRQKTRWTINQNDRNAAWDVWYAWSDWFALQRILDATAPGPPKPHLLFKFNMARAGCFYSQSELKEVYERYIIAKLTG